MIDCEDLGADCEDFELDTEDSGVDCEDFELDAEDSGVDCEDFELDAEDSGPDIKYLGTVLAFLSMLIYILAIIIMDTTKIKNTLQNITIVFFNLDLNIGRPPWLR